MDPLILKIALVPWEPVVYLVLFAVYARAFSGASIDGAGMGQLGWRHGAQAISVSATGTFMALAFMAVTLLGLASGASMEFLPAGLSVLQVIILIGAFDAVVASGAATYAVAVNPGWMNLDEDGLERSVLLRLMTARSWLFFALLRLAMAGALIVMEPAAGMARHAATGNGGASASSMDALNKKLTGMEARLDEIAKVSLPALTLKLDAARENMQKASTDSWPDVKVGPGATLMRAAVDQLKGALRAEIATAPADGKVSSSAMGPSMINILESFSAVLDSDMQAADGRKAETVRALLALIEPMAQRLGVGSAMAQKSTGMVAAADIPAAITFSFPSGANTVPTQSDDGRPLAAALNDMSAFVRAHSGCLVLVEGHADAKGREDTNLLLSLERAEGIAGPLRDKLDSGHVIAVPRGEREPLVKTKDGVENPKNRRVTLAARCLYEIKAPDAATKKIAQAS